MSFKPISHPTLSPKLRYPLGSLFYIGRSRSFKQSLHFCKLGKGSWCRSLYRMQGKRLSGHRSLLRKNSFGGGSKAGNRQNCFKCGKPGHWSRSCPNNEVANFSRKDSSSNKLEGNSSKTFSLFHRF